MVDKIKRNIVEDSAVTQPKLATGAVDSNALNSTAITGFSELTDAADNDVMLIYDASADAIKKITKARTTNLDFPTYTSVSPDNSQTVDGGNITFTITGSGFTAGTNARLISNTGVRLDFDTVTRASATSITGTIARSSLLVAQSPYDIQVINGEGLSVVGANQITVDNTPVFVTSAGSLGSFVEGSSIDITIDARDPDSSSAVSFEIQSGSLPAGLSLVNQSGDSCRITGTATAVSADTTSNFTLRAFDTASNTVSRAFSITILDFTTTSAKFDDGSSDYLTFSPSSTTNRKTFTHSFWFKTSMPGSTIAMFSTGDYSGGDGFLQINLSSSGRMVIDDYDQSGNSYQMRYVSPTTGPLFTDPAAWYHLVLAVDTTQASAGDRINIYVNGNNITSTFTKTTDSSQNDDFHVNISGKRQQYGRSQNNDNYMSGYLSEIHFIDGTALAPTSFGETDSNGVWVPINYSGSYGTNGYHLDFADASDLGDDESGNGNDFTEGNLTSIDKFEDSPQNNYITLNPLDPTADITLSEGNLKAVYGTSGTRDVQGSTIGLSSGKWYWEVKIGGTSSPNNAIVGITQLSTDNNTVLGTADNSWGYRGYDGKVYHNNSSAADLGTFGDTDIVGVYMDLDNHKLYFAKNGGLQNSTGISLDTGKDYFPAISDAGSSATPQFEMNFGAGTSFTISSGNTDGTFGNFEYSTTITGDSASKTFKAINTKNIANFG